ncbi:hypothetical protein LEMLEM_LOCUS25631 [Lemmus lemmus]
MRGPSVEDRKPGGPSCLLPLAHLACHLGAAGLVFPPAGDDDGEPGFDGGQGPGEVDSDYELIARSHDLVLLGAVAHGQYQWQGEGTDHCGAVEGRDASVGHLSQQLTAVRSTAPLGIGREALVLHVGVEGEHHRLDILARFVADLRRECHLLTRHEGVLAHLHLQAHPALATAAI